MLWLFVTILVFLYCLYANHRERMERKELRLESVGKWKGDVEGGLEVRHVPGTGGRAVPPERWKKAREYGHLGKNKG